MRAGKVQRTLPDDYSVRVAGATSFDIAFELQGLADHALVELFLEDFLADFVYFCVVEVEVVRDQVVAARKDAVADIQKR